MVFRKKKTPQQATADKMAEQTKKMIEEAQAMTQSAAGRGKIDPQKLMDAAERMQKLIEKENADRDRRMKQLEETSKKLKASSDELLKTAEKMEEDLRQKNMAHANEQQREAEWRKDGCPVTKPVTVGKPIKLKKPAP